MVRGWRVWLMVCVVGVMAEELAAVRCDLEDFAAEVFESFGRADQRRPVRFWFSNLPEGTPLTTLVRLAKLRWRIEHDYREMKQALGLAHFEGRTWRGWHHHVTLVSAAHAFCTLQRLARAPKDTAPA